MSPDQQLLLWINQGWAHPALDGFMIWVSSKPTFSQPLLLILGLLFIWRYRLHNGFKLWICLLLTVGLGDLLGYAIKHLSEIARPCFDLVELVRQPQNPAGGACGDGLHGLPSNHTLDFTAATVFVILATRRLDWGLTMVIVTVSVALSRIYLGKHYPSQVLLGFALGIGVAYASVLLYRRFLPFFNQLDSPAANRDEK